MKIELIKLVKGKLKQKILLGEGKGFCKVMNQLRSIE